MVRNMKIRLGYVAISRTLDVTPNSTITYTQFLKDQNIDKIYHIIEKNLDSLQELLQYNIKNNIHFYRLTSQLIPLATKEDVEFDYIKPFQKQYTILKQMIQENNLRIDMHPDQFCVLNSTKKEVVENTFHILEHSYQVLECLGIQNKIIILHVGSSVFGKENSIKRFIHNFHKLPKHIQQVIAIENDDKVYTIVDCLQLCNQLHIPMVLDYHHYLCNHGEEKIEEYLQAIFDTWKNKGLPPKIHFSSPKNKTKKEFRTHHDYIDIYTFIDFLNKLNTTNEQLDIMLEAKAKDDALFRLMRQLKYKTNYTFLDDTSFII